MSELIGIREAARRLGVSDTAVHKAIKSGRVQIAGRTAKSDRPLVSWPEVQTDWHANTDETRRYQVGSQGSPARRKDRKPDRPLTTITEAVQAVEVAEAVQAIEVPETVQPVEVPEAVQPVEVVQVVTQDESPLGDAPTLAQSRAVREAYMAKLAKIEYEKAIGKLIESDTVKVQAFKVARQVRDGLMNIPDRVAAELAHETNPAQIHARLQREIRDVLASLAAA